MSERCFTQPFVVVASIIEQDHKILFAKIAKGTSQGLWDLPAGWVDLGEHIVDAVKRETREETGLEFTPTGLIRVYSYVRQSKQRAESVIQPVTFAFRGTFTGVPTCDGSEITDFQWFSLEEILAMDETIIRSNNEKQIIKDYFDGKSTSLDLIRHEVQSSIS